MYKCMSVQFAHKVLGPVDSGDKLVASRCAELMEAFYNGTDPGMDLWFAPKEKVASTAPSA
jgi:hypothetical protein